MVDFRERRSKLERGGVQAALGIFQLRAERRRLVRIRPVARRGDPSHREEPRQHRKNVSAVKRSAVFPLGKTLFLGRTDRDLSRDLSKLRAHPLTFPLTSPHDMAASYATDVGGGSHHDALLGLRDLPSFQDKYTVECVEARLSFFRLLRPERRRRLTSPRPRRPRPRRPRPLLPRYLWLGGCGGDLRSKTKTLEGPIRGLQDLPKWNYDGSSTNQAPGIDSEVVLVPRAVFRDPFRATPRDRLIGDEFTKNKTTPVMDGKMSVSVVEGQKPRGPAQAALESARAAISSALVPAKSDEDAPPVLDGCRNLLVMCDTYTPAGAPIPTNTRARGLSLIHI